MARGFGSTLGSGTTDAVVSSLTAHASQRTWSFWAYRNGAGGGGVGRMFDKRTSGAQVETMLVSSTQYQFGATWNTTSGLWAITAPSTGVWAHVAVSYDSGSTANVPVIYLDGVAQSVSAITSPAGTLTTNGDAYVWGNRTNDSARVWDGALAEAAIHDAILTAAEVLALARGESPQRIRRSSLVEYLPWIGSRTASMVRSSPTTTGTAAYAHPRTRPMWAGRGGWRGARSARAYALTADAASYTLTASAAALKAARRITGAAASYTLTVGDATLIYDAAGSATLAADAASYAVTGSAAALRADRRLSSAAASFAITGGSAGLTVARRLTGAAGAFTLTGDPATLTYSGEAVTIPAGPTLRLASHNRRLVLPAQRRTLRIAA